MRKKFLIVLYGLISLCPAVSAQDSLQTRTLHEVVVTGTKFELPVEKSGKTIFKLSKEDLEKNSGKSLADLLNEIPGLQMDGNFSAPGTNVSYYVRGGRNRNTLVLIDGVPLNDPSAIAAEYDLRYIPTSQIESIEVLKGGLSTLYGTNAAAGVINITLKKSTDKVSTEASAEVGSFKTFSQNLQVSGTQESFSFLLNGARTTSEGFSSAQDNDPAVEFDKDGFKRQNVLLRLGYQFTPELKVDVQGAYEEYKADFDAFEFADAKNRQNNEQVRVGVHPQFKYNKGKVEAKLFLNKNEKTYRGDYPSDYKGSNMQGEIINRHNFSETISLLSGVNFQQMSFGGKDLFTEIRRSETKMHMIDPYTSVFLDHESGFNLHVGARLNTHSVYDPKFVYNINPAFMLNQDGAWNHKVYASLSTSYITPTLYQLYSSYGNLDLVPEEAVNYEAGFGVTHTVVSFTSAFFYREESSPIDFVGFIDGNGNFVFQYQNTVAERIVKGVEFTVDYNPLKWARFSGNYSYSEADKPTTFYKIPNTKFGVTAEVNPLEDLTISLKYNFTGDRTSFDFFLNEEVELKQYQLFDLFASYSFGDEKVTLYGAVNNLFDEKFVALYGYTTRGRNYNAGVRFKF
jgi:vitamin B12 transporter